MDLKRWMVFLGIWFCIALLPPLLIRQFVAQPFKIPTAAMQPTLMGKTVDPAGHIVAGDQILVNKTAYWTHPPQRGDIVVFSTDGIEHPYVRKSTYYVKRIVGLPGETVAIHPPYLMMNGSPVIAPEIFSVITSGKDGYHGFTLAAGGPEANAILSNPDDAITLGSGEYFVLGDNSVNSLDSRYFGPVRRESILGKVCYLYAPADRQRRIR